MSNNFSIAAAIAANNEDEQEAIKGYYQLLELITDPADQAVIKEIISDEKNHSQLLNDMVLKYDTNIAAAED
jgi:rubrerythrin